MEQEGQQDSETHGFPLRGFPQRLASSVTRAVGQLADGSRSSQIPLHSSSHVEIHPLPPPIRTFTRPGKERCSARVRSLSSVQPPRPWAWVTYTALPEVRDQMKVPCEPPRCSKCVRYVLCCRSCGSRQEWSSSLGESGPS